MIFGQLNRGMTMGVNSIRRVAVQALCAVSLVGAAAVQAQEK